MHQLKIALSLALLFVITSQQVCATSQYFNGQRCAPCKTNCLCSSENQCTSCMPGYTYDAKFENCLACPTAVSATNVGCAQCCYQIVSTAFVCSSCPALSSTFLLGGQCVRIPGCLSVNNNGYCNSCSSGYFLKDGTCIACHASCSSCSDSTFCTACAAGYHNSTLGNYGNCITCPTGCSTCSISGVTTTCSACSPGYRLSVSTCTSCAANCLQCTASACTSCATGFALISGACYACTTTLYSGTAGCQVCTSASSVITCSKCADGYYLTVGSNCAPCTSRFPNSALCTNSVAIQCQNDFSANVASRYYLVSNQCIANTKRCKLMRNTQGDCQSCYFEPGNYYQLVGTTCVQCSQSGCASYSATCQCLSCQNGYQFVNQQCVACQNLNCNICQSDVRSCQVCSTYYGLISSACIQCTQNVCLNCDGDSNKCITCLTGYYNSAGTCYKCQASCQTCSSSTVCTSCNAGNYLLSNGRCKSLPTNCVSVSTTGTCIKCNYGYMIHSGICVPCSTTLFNLNSCEKFCPSYYAQRTFQFKIETFLLLALIILISLDY